MTVRAIDNPERPPFILALRNEAERTVDSSAGGMDSNLPLGPGRFAAPVASEPGFSFDAEFRVFGARGHHGVTFRPGMVIDAPDELFERSVRFAFGRRC